MFDKPFARNSLAAAVFGALLLFAYPVFAGSPHNYDKSGKVILITRDPGFAYEVESDDNMYTLACARIRLFHLVPPDCDWNGSPLAVGDQVRFRIDGDDAYMPLKGDSEERFVVQMTESKLLPALPAVRSGFEGAVVLGRGISPEVYQYFIPPDTQSSNTTASSPTSSDSMAPVVAIPTTGGEPVVVIPTAPANGGVVMGVPATGGSPITAIPVTPTDTGASSAPNLPVQSTSSGTTASATRWIRIVRVQTASRVYDLACPTRNCTLNSSPIQTGDALALRVEKKWAYVSAAANPREQRFAIVSVRDLE